MTLPLEGKTVLLTREKTSSEKMAETLRAYGAEPIIRSVMKIIPAPLSEKEWAILEKADDFDWLIFTSANGVKAFMDLINARGIRISSPKFAAVGLKTAKMIESYGFKVERWPKEFTAESLAEAFRQAAPKGATALLLLGNLAKSDLETELHQAGMSVTRLDVYQTVLNAAIREALTDVLTNRRIDVITFASPSAIDFFLALTDGLDLKDFWNNALVACIGKVSAAHARKRGLCPRVVPKTFTAESLIEAIVDFYKTSTL